LLARVHWSTAVWQLVHFASFSSGLREHRVMPTQGLLAANCVVGQTYCTSSQIRPNNVTRQKC